ncbi:protein Shroom2-like isoform X1 [Myxocyprinus asiaticus]|uniref:protein Shroom2-like isoform X1 n=2 Tax=Myxocyprinus asiaticus TaxID=70543 RepID=UPI002221701F|nr:protein Shroom2-like isoform X1 [Myxocyprinus asiaticus]
MVEMVDSRVHYGVLSGENISAEHHDEDHTMKDEEFEFLELILTGGSPWGFTLRGGLEYHEPLLVTKVEDGSPAALGRLQIGDEIVSVNSLLLSGYRQEAICLVKSSHKTLSLGIKRRNESSCRPHSWHSAKPTENPTTDITKSEPNPGAEPTWQTKYDAGSPAKDNTSCWGQTNLRKVSCQFSSVGNMESVEPSTHAFSKEPALSNKPSSVEDHPMVEKAANKRTSACNAFLSGSTDHSAPRGIIPTEGMFYRGSPNEIGVPSDCHRYLQIPMGNGGQVSPSMEDQAGSKFSSSGRSNHGPVWHVPENKLLTSAASPAPPPPLRSDSFTATRVHEKTMVGSFPEGLPSFPQQKSHCRAVDRPFDDYHASDRGHEVRHSFNLPQKKDFLHPYLSVENYNPNQQNTNKQFSHSSTDVRQGQNPFTYELQHQRQHSDESPFSMNPGTTYTTKTQSIGNYYRSLQDLPNNTGSRNQARTSTASLLNTAFDHNHEGQAHFRYYCITAQQPSLESSTLAQGWMGDEWRSDTGTTQGVTERSFVGSQKVIKTKYPQPYLSLPENKSSSGYSKQQTISLPSSEAASLGPDRVISKSSSGEREREGQKKKFADVKQQPSRQESNHQTEQKNPVSTYHQDNPWIIKQDQKICPQKTPMLHSLAQESKKADKSIITSKVGGHQETTDSLGGKQGRRSDRYATTLRNEIQQKKAQLQKSRSAATLTCPSEVEEDSGIWKSNETSTSSSDGSFTNTYKDHLKEAQAKVLKATSFMRKDLELPENEASPGQAPKRLGPVHGQVTRIGGRKRFSMDKKIHSFSEPDKINEVGVEDKLGSFVDRYKFFEGSCRLTLQKPIPKQSLLSPSEDLNERKSKLTGDGESILRAPIKQSKSSHSYLNAEEQQRLGTFAEYEATWNLKKKPLERRTTGRYHSAENILDSGLDESNSAVCIHERSRSSPSADFCGQNIPLPPRQSPVQSPSECKDQQQTCITSLSEREHDPVIISEPLESITLNVLEKEHTAASLLLNQRLRPDSRHPPSLSSHHLQVPVSEQILPKNKMLEPQRSAQVRMDKKLETMGPSRVAQEVQPIAQGITAVQTPSPDSTQGSTRLCTTHCPLEHLERDMFLTTEQENGQKSDSGGLFSLLGRSSISPQRNADLTITSANRTRSPSPQFFPQRFTDEPLTTVQKKDPHSYKMEETLEPNTAGRKVPIQIVYLENGSERDCRNYLLHGETLGGSEFPITSQLKQLDSPEQPKSLFSACARPDPNRNTDRTSSEHQIDNETVRTDSLSEHSEEDLKREELARDIMGKDKSLVDILDQSKMKTTMDLMEGIFPQGEQLLEGAQLRRKATSKQTPPKTQQRVEDSLASSVSLVSSSSYYSTSAPKAELLIKMKDLQELMEEQDSEDELDYDVSSKKQELIDSLSKKLQVLREARESLQEDIQDNNLLGEEVEATVQTVCKPNELEKFRMFVGDLDKVVSLLLSLSGRLARVENALNNLEEGTSADEKNTLTEKRKLLIRQHEDAKELKENLDRRERLVYDILDSCLSEECLADYKHFVKMKSALIIEQRKLEDKIKLGEEQLKCLKDSMPLDQRLLY